jgi:hypothetical protein
MRRKYSIQTPRNSKAESFENAAAAALGDKHENVSLEELMESTREQYGAAYEPRSAHLEPDHEEMEIDTGERIERWRQTWEAGGQKAHHTG